MEMEDRGEYSASAKSSDEIWAKLVPSDSRYSEVEIRSDESVICSEISATLSDKHSWCKVVRSSDLCSATMENKSQTTILVDGAEVCNDNTIVIKDGSEIIPGPDKEGFVSYRFHIMSSPETRQRQLKICVDVENAKCSICLHIWHDVVTIGPCLHNFCNGCFSEWSRRSREKRSTVFCPQCRAGVQFVGRNPFPRTIAEDIVRADSSLRRSDEEIALLDTHASGRSNLAEGVLGAGAGPMHMDQAEGSDGDEEEEETDSDDQDDEEESDSEYLVDDDETDSSLSHSDEEIAPLVTYTLVRPNIAEGVPGAQPIVEQPVSPPPTTSTSQSDSASNSILIAKMEQLQSKQLELQQLQQQQQLQQRACFDRIEQLQIKQMAFFDRIEQWQQKQMAYFDHMFLQQAATHRASCAIYESSYRASLRQGSPSPYPWPTPEDFAARVTWPGDRPTFEEGVSSHGPGPGPVPTDQAGGSGGDEEQEIDSEDQDDEEGGTHSEDQDNEQETDSE